MVHFVGGSTQKLCKVTKFKSLLLPADTIFVVVHIHFAVFMWLKSIIYFSLS